MKCPLCSSSLSITLLDISCGGFDQSTLYRQLKVVACNNCGHIYNLIDENQIQGIINYYNTEYSHSNLQSPNKQGDMPGSNNSNSTIRYINLFDTISNYVKPDDFVLDIGCATGGFLKHLHSKTYRNLYGIDFSEPYIEESSKFSGIHFKKGSAESIPFEDNFFDFIVSDQVVEHLFDPNNIFIEAKRVLKKGGYFCVSVPNANRYQDDYFFDYYMFLMREHIQHFDRDHLIALGAKHGFEPVNTTNTKSFFFNKETFLPFLTTIFKYTCRENQSECSMTVVDKVREYLQYCSNRLDRKIPQVLKLLNIPSLYFWGIGREFFYLYENTSLNRCDIRGLIDDTPVKQTYTVNGMRIFSSDIIRNLPSSATIVITAFAHSKLLKEKLVNMGYKGSIFEVSNE
jgi:SAM-dependent methyltransferase